MAHKENCKVPTPQGYVVPCHCIIHPRETARPDKHPLCSELTLVMQFAAQHPQNNSILANQRGGSRVKQVATHHKGKAITPINA